MKDPTEYMKTVAELIEYLKTLPQDSYVVQSSDAEGNNLSPWSGDHAEGFYVPIQTWYGDFYPQQDVDNGDYEYDPDSDEVRCIVLWPIN